MAKKKKVKEKIEEIEEEDPKKHILKTLNEILMHLMCPLDDKWKCNSCENLGEHITYICESIACLIGVVHNMIITNNLELMEMRKDPIAESINECVEEVVNGTMYS